MSTAIDLTVPAVHLSRDAMAQLRANATEYLSAAVSDDEKMERARYLYWECPAIPAKLIAGVLWGDEKLGNDVAAWVGPFDFGKCGICSSPLHARSRSSRADAMRFESRGFLPVCGECAAKDEAQKAAERREQERQEWERLRELRTMPYREYLLTEEWQKKRRQKLRQAGYACQLCNSGSRLNVHHRTYERRGCEYLSDLTVLCEPCHGKFHDKLP